ncbi:carboxypeptidase-like regulatory domain-containing protein [Gillisia sp. CAL575]|uniref:carboxypeptidase-like regulatory domain-containing protein n=1 Tax=Gillisia sp. CAL575 TaxID=985255 RepID=UPI0003A3BB8E|nr:carboxypeptidase-like regulatory domain-containing protein [Gillisia sp. CAL575]
MKSLVLSAVLTFFAFVQIAKAKEISGQILDFSNKEPIPFATLVYANERGVLANEEGKFNIQANLDPSTIISISSIGYETKELPISKVNGHIIYLKSQSIQLNDVFLSDKMLSAEEIISKVSQNVRDNYNFNYTQKRFFFRESDVNYVRQFDMDIDESTIPELNQSLMDSISKSIPKMSDSYREVLGDLYGNYAEQKLNVLKAANLENPKSRESLTELSDKLQNIFQKTLKKNSYLKIKSGWLGVKVDAEELRDELNEHEEGVAIKPEPTAEELEKIKATKLKYLKQNTVSDINGLLNAMFWKSDNTLDVFEKSRKYKFEVNGYVQIENVMAYVIDFEPKRGGDFKGRIFVNTQDFGVYRIDFENVKDLSSFRLLGISTASDVYSGKMIFGKDEIGKYNAKYLELVKGESFGVERPLTIIEKNKLVAGKRKQNELDLDIKIKVKQLNKLQLIVFENSNLEASDFKNFKSKDEDFEYQKFTNYNPEFWDGYNIIEPNAAIKAFTAPQTED